MPKVRKSPQEQPRRRPQPALSPEAREKQLISAAIDLAEQQLLDGTASATVITHYLKLATRREEIEREKLAREVELLNAKTEAIQSAQRMEELYANAIAAMRRYSGEEQENTYEYDEDLQ